MSRNFSNQRGDDFYNAAFNFSPINSSAPSQVSHNSPSTPQYPPYIPSPNDYQYQQWLHYQQWLSQQQQPSTQPPPQVAVQPPPQPPPVAPQPPPVDIPESSIPKRKVKRMASRKKGDAVDPPETKKAWTELEMKILTECWLDASEDPDFGTDRKGDIFWDTVMENYNAQVEFQRRNNQMTSKWRKIRAQVAKFNAIYAKYDDNRISGENDTQVMEEARQAYKDEVGAPFNMYDCWLLLKDKSLILTSSAVDVLGRNMKNQRPGVVDLESEDDVPAYEPVDLGTENELFGPDPYAHPSKSKTPRTSASSDAGSARSSASDIATRLEKHCSTQQEIMESQKKSLAWIREEETKRTMYSALSFMGDRVGRRGENVHQGREKEAHGGVFTVGPRSL
uniref:uncharacterized protein LOC122610758 n=1 Tax=Erigeron canadensis TaxID=72917 RepID=UPI001CB8D75B|nr:uncharacterized protein LOC122610758 [Erigeron canadensis]